ncbi:MAG: colanic acid biosynthesis glycosyltransferase WcaL, partial [Cyanobacteriota bacterium]|nr:colanic acid biosynthesis glycosyltransferase WcaL [Cyanobacteriota bacterium]
MRIAFIVSQFPMLSETFILNQVTGLIERGHEVDIYTERFGDWNYVHPDVNNYQLRERTFLLESVPENYALRVVKGLGLLLTNFHKQPQLILNSLNIFKSGLQAAGLWLLYSA